MPAALEQWERLAARGIAVVDGEVTGLDVVEDRLAGVWLAPGRQVPVEALVVAPRFVARRAGLQPTRVRQQAGSPGACVEPAGKMTTK